MYMLTDTETALYFPEIAEKELSETDLKKFFFNSDYCNGKNEYNNDFPAWLNDSIKYGFFKIIRK